MSFLAGGGSECAANNNPLAQLSKRSDFDTSLHSTIQNSSLQQSQTGNGLSAQRAMNQNDKLLMENFMQQQQQQQQNQPLFQQSSAHFNFQPMTNELHNIQQNVHSNLQSKSNWSAEFQSNSPISITNTNVSSLNQLPTNNSMHMRHLPMRQMPMQMNTFHQVSQPLFQQSQPDLKSSMDTQQNHINWEDSFNAIEKDLVGGDDSVIEINEIKSNMDGMNKIPSSTIFDKYHDEYKFEEVNDFLNTPDAYEIGCRLMAGGAKLSEAALAFEAAVRQDPKHIDAWLKLGQVQIQNEKELNGITALENCLLIDPQNLTALMSLAISYVNEGYDNAAFKTFENWIETKYPDIVSKAKAENPNDVSDDRYSLNKRITNLFLKAAQLSPSGVNIDSEVQTGLGVLFYSMEEYDKTLDCFQSAIRCNPNDALSWNRLGASYANSNRPEQAIESYSKALQLNPNFVRARYNLGVSFINMGMYKDAVNHLLIGLSMHEIDSPDGLVVKDSQQSSNLIETLKRAFLAMDRRDLIDKVRPGMNVGQFRSEFKV